MLDAADPFLHGSQDLNVFHGIHAVVGGQAVFHQIANELQGSVGIALFYEKEIRALFVNLRQLAAVDAVGIFYDVRGFRLAKHFVQLHGRHFPGIQNVLQHIARPHRRQLIHVADENQAGLFL